MPVHLGGDPANGLLAKTKSVRLGTDRKTSLLRDRSAKACGQARFRMSVAHSSSLRATSGTISSSRCQTTCFSRSSIARNKSGAWTRCGVARRGSVASLNRHSTEDFPLKACHSRLGGARRDRTDDLLLAKQALSQLSYGPGCERIALCKVVGLGRFELPTSRLSSARSNQLSYKPNDRPHSSRMDARGTGSSMKKEK